jgi:hypothetical protein
MIERKKVKTPAGGVALLAKYVDDSGKETTKDKATRVIVAELDEQDNTIAKAILVKGSGSKPSAS